MDNRGLNLGNISPGESSLGIEGSLANRLRSEDWKTRFDALVALANELALDNSDSAQSHLLLLKGSLSDSQPWVQEKALDTLLLALDKHYFAVISSLEDIVNAIVESCLKSEKPIIKDKGTEALIKLCKNDSVRAKIAKLMAKPKVAEMRVLIELMQKYGKAAFNLNECFEELRGIELNNTPIGNEALILYRIACKTFGNEVTPFIKNLKPSQQEELNNLIQQTINPNTPTNTILEENKSTVINSLDKFDAKWCAEMLSSDIVSLKEWNEKRNRLEELLNVVSNANAKANISKELAETLPKLIDANQVVVAQYSLQIVTNLAKLLKEKFVKYYKPMIRPILNRLKDIKTADDALKCLKIISPYIELEEIIEDIKITLKDNSTTLRSNLCQWLEQFILAQKNDVRVLVPLLISCLNNSADDLNKSALMCLGIIYLKTGDLEVMKVNGIDEGIEAAKKKYPMLSEASEGKKSLIENVEEEKLGNFVI